MKSFLLMQQHFSDSVFFYLIYYSFGYLIIATCKLRSNVAATTRTSTSTFTYAVALLMIQDVLECHEEVVIGIQNKLVFWIVGCWNRYLAGNRLLKEI